MVRQETFQPYTQTLKRQMMILGVFIGFFYMIELLDMVAFQGGLDLLAISPRNPTSLSGIFFAPFLHDGFGHLIANTVPFLVLGWLTMMRGLREFAIVTFLVMLISGLGTWLIGPAHSLHLGASGLVFGFFGYLVLRGILERSWQSIAIAVVTVLLYGSMIFGIFPTNPGISWQMHLFGLLGGGFAAYILARGQASAETPQRIIENEIRIGL